MLSATPAASSVLAFITTVHAGLIVLRLHLGRPQAWSLAMPSLGFAALTWVLATPSWLAIGLAANVAWFVACQKATAQAQPGAERESSAPARPGSPSATGAAVSGSGRAAGAGFLKVPVLAVHDECDGIRTLRLVRPAGFTFDAGQFLTVQVQTDGRPAVRCYSISSPPEVPGYLEISVRRQGVVSGLLHSTISAGSTLLVRSPAGRFVYPAGDDRPLVLLAAGVGITPLMSMLRHAVVADAARPVTLIYSTKRPEEIAYRDELNLLAQRHPQVRVVITITADTAVGLCRRGRIDAALVSEVVRDPVGAIFMICGPAPMIDASKTLLQGLGVPPGQVRFEAFEAAAAVGAKLPGQAAAQTGSVPGEACGQLTLARSKQRVEIRAGESLLDAAEKAGADIPTVCRSGVCGTCRTRLLSGDARCTSDTLADADRDEGYILPCVSWADGDCVLEA